MSAAEGAVPYGQELAVAWHAPQVKVMLSDWPATAFCAPGVGLSIAGKLTTRVTES